MTTYVDCLVPAFHAKDRCGIVSMLRRRVSDLRTSDFGLFSILVVLCVLTHPFAIGVRQRFARRR